VDDTILNNNKVGKINLPLIIAPNLKVEKTP
jgi:hypothetical protein